MENNSHSDLQCKKRKYGPKKGFLSRISVDSDSVSCSSADQHSHTANRLSYSLNGDNHSEKGVNQSARNSELPFNQSSRMHSADGQKYSLNVSNQFARRQSADGNKTFMTNGDDKSVKFKLLNSHPAKTQNSALGSQYIDSNDQGSKISALVSRSFSTGSEIIDGQSKSLKQQSSESISTMSLPEDLRLSFSEIEEGSLQLDDLDLTYSPASGGNNSSGNLCNMDQEKCFDQDGDLQRFAAIISSTSEQQASDKEITEMTKLSEEFMTKEDQSSGKEQNNVVVKSESSNSNANITWDDIVQWGVNAQQVSTVGSSGEVLKQKKTISPRRSSKSKHMENVSCQVCGDMAAGFYCGAFICEACKKFYMRAYKQDKLKYVCLRDKKCMITKESRVQCQYCRFQKCVTLNMYIPKQGESEMSKDMQMSDIPCRVCSAPSSGFHFGAITCEGCKGFFRRMAKEREPEKYQCNKKGRCEINMVTRNLCKACRYRSCREAGMSVEGSRIGRQPNSVKHAISMELKQVKPEGESDVVTKIKEEPIDESSIDFLKDSDKSESFSFWDEKSDNSVNQTLNNQSALCDNQVISSANMNVKEPSLDTHTSVGHVSPSVSNNVSWSSSINNVNRIPPTSPINGTLPKPSQTHMSVGNTIHTKADPQSYNGKQMTNQQNHVSVGGHIQRHMLPPPQMSAGDLNRGQSNGPSGNSLVFTPSPVTQFFSTAPRNENKQYVSSNQQPRDNQANHKVPAPIDTTQNINQASATPQPILYSPTSTTAPHGNNEGMGQGSFQNMTEFISKIIEAGKCLQLLNYRVFDTDVNPTTSMNVDDIKALFKSKYMDPKAGNHITSKVDMSVFSSRESTWNYMMTNFHHNTYITIRFAKLVPGFKTLSLNDQVKLIQSSIYPIELLNMSKVYDPTTKKYNYFTYTKEEENIMMEQFPMLRVFQEHFLHVGEMVTSFNFTDEEFAILSALLLFPAEANGLENPKAVEQLQNQISAALQAYEEREFPEGLTRYGILLVRVAELVQCLLQHNLAIGLLLTHNPTIKVPQLFHELIIESIKEGQKL
ncbi:uncharacterized protein LOC123531312 [Mercenaria mercenaria]|uniref:uncharacterized protein LOC123531312 n=1 Tax=Mercenaria mercenaria TaxID=6596 RepID=UPI00234F828F|nr:uncharacterized protein LOC123531312 [Mercenaria mercenaria]XP_045168105.2 uncharacterized protein LOC123531312 [Mercenaria mercenaria]